MGRGGDPCTEVVSAAHTEGLSWSDTCPLDPPSVFSLPPDPPLHPERVSSGEEHFPTIRNTPGMTSSGLGLGVGVMVREWALKLRPDSAALACLQGSLGLLLQAQPTSASGRNPQGFETLYLV